MSDQAILGMTPRDVARFLSHVAVGDGCWLWTSWLRRDGYGGFAVPAAGAAAQRRCKARRLAAAASSVTP